MGGGKKKRSTKKKKTYSKAQKMAQKRIGTGTAKKPNKSISSIKAANIKSMQDKARERHAKFKQTKVQTFGGKKTSFSKAEEKRITDANYSVEGYSKAPFKSQPQLKSEAQLQVERDNPNNNLVATAYKDLSPGLQNILQNQLKSFEKQGLGEGEFKRLQKMYPGFKKADLGGNLVAASDLSGLSIGNINTEGPKDFSSIVGIKSPSTFGYPSQDAVDKAAGITSGGLNIGGSGFIASKNNEGSKTGRTLTQKIGTFASNLVQQPKALLAYGTDVAKQLFSPSLADGTLSGNTDFAGNLPGDEGFDNRDVQIKGAFNNAMNSNFVQQYGENLGLPKDFKAQTKDLMSALAENYKGATADRDGIYAGTSETLKTLSSNEKLAPLAKFLNQLGSDNENVLDSDRNKKFSMMGFETPLSNEMAADIITSFQPNVDKMQGLSFKDRGLIEGSAGNLLISGKLTDIAREALIGDKGSGETLGLNKGSPLTIGNMIDAGNLISSNLKDSKTLASKRSQEIANLANKAGKITTPSIIKGIIPKFGGSGSYRPKAVSSLGMGAATLAATPPASVEEVLPLPTTKALGGTNATDLSAIQKQAYNNQMSLYGMNPNYFATIMQPKFTAPKKKFSQYFNRDYIPKFA